MSEIRIEKGCAGELPDILDFANYVFSQSSQPHDFRRLLPKLYGENSGSEGYHYLVREDGRIRAMVCAMPLSLLVAGKPLRAAGIGTVSVHPYARGKGYMKALMNRAMEDLKTQGYAMAFLGGMRQRYEYFGFTPTGTRASLPSDGWQSGPSVSGAVRRRCFSFALGRAVFALVPGSLRALPAAAD